MTKDGAETRVLMSEIYVEALAAINKRTDLYYFVQGLHRSSGLKRVLMRFGSGS